MQGDPPLNVEVESEAIKSQETIKSQEADPLSLLDSFKEDPESENLYEEVNKLPLTTAHTKRLKKSGHQLKTLSTKHMLIVDLLILHPTKSNAEIAEMVGMTPTWVSAVKGTDLFQEELQYRLAMQRREHTRIYTAQTQMIGEKTNEQLLDRLDNAEEEFTSSELIALKKNMDTSLGHSVETQAKINAQNEGNQVIVNVNSVPGNVLAEARERLLSSKGE